MEKERPTPRCCEKCKDPGIVVAVVSQGWAAECRHCGHVWNCWFREIWPPHP